MINVHYEIQVFKVINFDSDISIDILSSGLAFLADFNLSKQYFLTDIALQIFYIMGQTNAGRNKQ